MNARKMSRRGLAAAGLATLGVVAASGVAYAYWTAQATNVPTYSTADSINSGSTPNATANGTSVNLSWTAVTTQGGRAVTGYVIKRYDAPSGGNVVSAAQGTCASTVATLSCTETGVPDGTWYYTTTPVLGAWLGAESPRSAAVTVASDVTPPTVMAVSSTSANGSYKAGTVIPVTVTFSETVTVTGTPTLTLSTGSPATTVVNYASGSGTATLTFNYTVVAGNTSADLDYAGTASLGLNGGTIKDAAGNAATLTLASPGTTGSLGGNKNLIVDTASPVVSTVSSTLANGSYKAGTVIPVTVTFAEPVIVTGTPQLTLSTGSPATTTANYAGGSGTATLTFNYTVAAGNTSADLDYAATSSLALNGGSISDNATNPAVLTLPSPGATGSLGANKNLVVDTAAPAVTSVSSTTLNGTYKVGDPISVTVNFTEAVNVTGTPKLALNSGGTASYASGSGTSALVFSYTVGAGDSSADLDEASAGALTLNGGTIKDSAGNDAALSVPASGAAGSLGANKNLVVDGVAPSVATVSSTTANGSYKAGAVIPITVTFDEPVTVTGTPRLTLSTGSPSTTAVNYTGGGGTATLTFNYTVASGNTSADLDYASTSALGLNGGTVKDAAGNAATLTLAAPGTSNSLGASKNIVIDTTAPGASAISSANKSSGTAGRMEAGDSVTFVFTEANGMSTNSIASGWSGSSPLNVVVRATDGGSSNNDSIAIYDSSNSVQLNLGTVDLGAQTFLSGSTTFGASGTSSTLSYSGTGTFVLTFGTVGNASLVGTDAGNNKLVWTPSASATDLAGNAASTSSKTGANTGQF